MISIGQDDLRADFFQLLLGHSLHGPGSPDGHEDGRFDVAMRGVQNPCPGPGVLIFGDNSKLQSHGVFVRVNPAGRKSGAYHSGGFATAWAEYQIVSTGRQGGNADRRSWLYEKIKANPPLAATNSTHAPRK